MTFDYVHEGLPGRVVFGVGAVERVSDEVAALGVERALVIAGGSSKETGDRIAGQLGGCYGGSFADVRQHVPEDLVAAARRAAGAMGVDGVVAVGGGSVIGLAKAIAVDAPIGVEMPIVAVPTTYSGSEMTAIYGITGRHKRIARDLRALPATVVYDPALTVALPPGLSATSGLNALAHAVEAYYGPGASPISDIYADAAIAALVAALPAVVDAPGDIDARSAALHGAHLAGRALAVAGTGLHHKLCHVLGGTFGLDHSRTHAVVLPHAVHLVAKSEPAAIARVSDALGGPAAERVAALAERVGAPTSLGELGMPAEGIDEAAGLGAEATGADEGELRALLEAAFAGDTTAIRGDT